MTDWQIRDDEQGEPVEIEHYGRVLLAGDRSNVIATSSLLTLIRTARADRDQWWLEGIAELIALPTPVALDRLRARVTEGK